MIDWYQYWHIISPPQFSKLKHKSNHWSPFNTQHTYYISVTLYVSYISVTLYTRITLQWYLVRKEDNFNHVHRALMNINNIRTFKLEVCHGESHTSICCLYTMLHKVSSISHDRIKTEFMQKKHRPANRPTDWKHTYHY